MGSIGKAFSILYDTQLEEWVSFQYLYFLNTGLIREESCKCDLKGWGGGPAIDLEPQHKACRWSRHFTNAGCNHARFQCFSIRATLWKQASTECSVCTDTSICTRTCIHTHSCYTLLNWPQMEDFCCGRLPSVRCLPSCRLTAIWPIKEGEVKLNKWQLDGNGIL